MSFDMALAVTKSRILYALLYEIIISSKRHQKLLWWVHDHGFHQTQYLLRLKKRKTQPFTSTEWYHCQNQGLTIRLY